jgi:hypothetical protein
MAPQEKRDLSANQQSPTGLSACLATVRMRPMPTENQDSVS